MNATWLVFFHFLSTNEIAKLIELTVEILYFVRPKINIKATDEE